MSTRDDRTTTDELLRSALAPGALLLAIVALDLAAHWLGVL